MSYVALKVMKSFQEIAFAFGYQSEYSFVFHRNTDLYNRRASKIASSVNSLFTALYTSQWPLWFSNRHQLSVPIFCSSTYVFPMDDNVKNYLLWRQINLTAVSVQEIKTETARGGTTLIRKIVKITPLTKSRIYVIPFAVDFNHESVWLRHPELLSGGKPGLMQLCEMSSTKLLDKYESLRRGENTSDLDLFKFWLEYQNKVDDGDTIKPLGSTLADTNAFKMNEFEIEDTIEPNLWIVIRIDGKGFHKFSAKHAFEKPNDADGKSKFIES